MRFVGELLTAAAVSIRPAIVMLGSARRPAPTGRPLRILEICSTFGVGGIERHVVDLAAWLRAEGHTVTLAGTPGEWVNPTLDPTMLPLGLFEVTADRPDGSIFGRVLALARAVIKLRAWLAHNPVDVIHAHETAPALVGRLAALGLGLPLVLTYHGASPSRIGQFGRVGRWCADRLVTTNRHSAGELQTLGRIAPVDIDVIGLGITAPPVAPERSAEVRRSLLGADGRRLVVTVARLAEQKSIDVLVETVRCVVAVRRDIHFAVVGEGPQRPQVEQWIAEAGVGANLHLVGRSHEPMLYLGAADLFLLTSSWEALPYVIVEGFTAGLPAVSTRCGGVAELIDAQVGRILPLGDAEGLAAAVLEICGDDALRSAMAAAARARSREDRFQHDFNHRRIEQSYRTVIDRRAPG